MVHVLRVQQTVNCIIYVYSNRQLMMNFCAILLSFTQFSDSKKQLVVCDKERYYQWTWFLLSSLSTWKILQQRDTGETELVPVT